MLVEFVHVTFVPSSAKYCHARERSLQSSIEACDSLYMTGCLYSEAVMIIVLPDQAFNDYLDGGILDCTVAP